MDCEDVRTYLLDDHRGQLAPELAREVRAHVERCAACAHDDAAEHALSELLERRLPQHPAPLALKRRLAAQWPAPGAARAPWWPRWRRAVAPALRADGLPWPARGGERIGGVDAYRQTARGFTVVLWRTGDLGYALVSDLDPKELATFASKLVG